MKRQHSILISTMHCIFAGFCSGFFFNLIMILIIMSFSDRLPANTLDDAIDNETGIELAADVKPSEVKQGSLLFKNVQGSTRNYTQAPTLDTDVHIQITGMTARATVKQNFHNDSADWKEGIYVFPLPENAAVDQLRMHIGERIIEGQIKEKQQARKEYQQAKASGKRASLVEQERPNIFTTSVANIGPYENIVIEITYQQTIRYSDEVFSLRFPMVVAPRYIPGKMVVSGFEGTGWSVNTDQVPDASKITPPVLNTEQDSEHRSINPVKIKIDLDAGFLLSHIDSPYHQINIGIPDKTRYSIQLQNKQVPANRDFVLVWQAEPENSPKAALFTEEKGSDIYSLIMLMPPTSETASVLHREVIFVIDTSGSMSGPSIVQAKQALNLALTRLKPGDRFNIIQFNSYTDKLFHFPQPVSHHALRQAQQYVDNLEAQGGTEMAPALRAALLKQNNHVDDKNADVRQIIFLTDGSIGNEDALFSIIQSQLGDSRLFTIGIGSAPNSHFMNRAAKFGRGTHTYIGNVSEVQTKMETLFTKLESPVLTNIHIQWPEDCANQNCGIESWPQNIPDLYLSEPLLISTKSVTLPESLTIKGEIAGKKWQASLNLKGGQKDSGIPVIWARKKIAALMDQMSQNQNTEGDKAEELRNNIVETALEHHLVSKYTSLIAVDVTPARTREALLKSHALPVNLPAGWDYNKVFGHMPTTATNATVAFMSGLLMLFAGMILLFTRNMLLR
ncbi:MAG: marine proteobacterial sortase target protein, partial [Gammaproteobacteria bacterium]|nr:marine proteobacterial sortase target protein [Gammaproteobacteria bacterium]